MVGNPWKRLTSSRAEPSADPTGNVLPNSAATTTWDEMPRNILAFRTITTLLSKIQQEPYNIQDALHKVPLTQRDRYRLKINNALSILAVTDHQVVAAISKGGNGEEAIEVIFSTSNPLHSTALTAAPQLTLGQSIVAAATALTTTVVNSLATASTYILDVLVFSQNPRRSDKNKPNITPFSIPTTIELTQECCNNLSPDAAIGDFLNQCWGKFTLKDHIWALGNLFLFQPTDEAPDFGKQEYHERLSYYTISACHRKIYRRMNHATLSMPYLKSLAGIPHTAIVFNRKHFDQRAPISTTMQEQEHDQAFLTSFLVATKPNDTTKLPSIDIGFEAKCFQSLVDRDTGQGQGPVQLYTAETCQEFHRIFVALLEGFLQSLQHLFDLQNPSSNKPSKLSAADVVSESIKCVPSIYLYGSLLLELSHGSAIQLHLCNIEPQIHAQYMYLNLLSRNSSNKLGDSNQSDAEELKAVQPFTPTWGGPPVPLWKSTRNWIRLTVSHFESVGIITHFFMLHPNISPVKTFLVVNPEDPGLDGQLLPWKELLAEPKFFPISAPPPEKNAVAAPVRTNSEILDFLSNGAKSAPEKWTWLGNEEGKAIPSGASTKYLGKLCRYLAKLAEAHPITSVVPVSSAAVSNSFGLYVEQPFAALLCNPNFNRSDGCIESEPSVPLDAYKWGERSRAILKLFFPDDDDLSTRIDKILKRKNYVYNKKFAIRNSEEINELFCTLDESAQLFRYLGQPHTETGFMGSLHCESCLASLIVPNSVHANHQSFKDLAGFNRIIGVSKRCCPVCRTLLSHLEREGPEVSTPISVTGSHGTVSPSTLPLWLPASIVDEMAATFGQQLRKELVNLMTTENWRKRTGSTGSGQGTSQDGFIGPSTSGNTVVRNQADMLQSHFPAEDLVPQTPQL